MIDKNQINKLKRFTPEQREQLAKCCVKIVSIETGQSIAEYEILIREATYGESDDYIEDLIDIEIMTPAKLLHVLVGAINMIKNGCGKNYTVKDMIKKAVHCVKNKGTVPRSNKSIGDDSGSNSEFMPEPREERKKKDKNPFRMNP